MKSAEIPLAQNLNSKIILSNIDKRKQQQIMLPELFSGKFFPSHHDHDPLHIFSRLVREIVQWLLHHDMFRKRISLRISLSCFLHENRGKCFRVFFSIYKYFHFLLPKFSIMFATGFSHILSAFLIFTQLEIRCKKILDF